MNEIDDGSRDKYNVKLASSSYVQTQQKGSSLKALISLCDRDSKLQVGEHHIVFKQVHALMLAILDESVHEQRLPSGL